MAASHWSGPVVSTAGFTPGASTVSLTLIKTGTIAVDPASLATLTSNETAVTITGALAGDVVVMNLPASFESGLLFGGAYVSASDTVKVRIGNATAGTIDGASRNWTYALFRMA